LIIKGIKRMRNNIYAAQLAIANATGILITAGAGMGVDSGLPDFRGNTGFWKAYPALAAAGIEFTRIASPAAFYENPAQAWGFYGHRLALYRDTQPHEGFALLKALADSKPQGAFVMTSNVDEQFQKAGFDAARVYECHGSIHTLQCMGTCCAATWRAHSVKPVVDVATGLMSSPLPRCQHCGGLARPNVLMFDDRDWLEHTASAARRRMDEWLATVERPVVIELGAGTHIATIRRASEQVARQRRCPLIRINPRDSETAALDGSGVPAYNVPLGALAGLQTLLTEPLGN
jgi:NAD-dependent SIR2 family protein deacetylase